MTNNAEPRPASSPAGKKKPLIFIPPEKRCAHTTYKGLPCRAARWRASRFCIFHDPNFRKLHKQLEQRNSSSAQQKSTRTAEGIHQMLEKAVDDVREKRISASEASSIGYLGQVMISNLKNFPRAEETNGPSRDFVEHMANNYTEMLLNSVNEEIARWIPDSSPIAVAQAERDVVKIAADASAKEAIRANAQTPAPADKLERPAPSDKPQPPWAGFDGSSLRAEAIAAKKRYAP